MKITTHFDSKEFDCRDGTPYPVARRRTHLLFLCATLEEIRAALGVPIKVLSGYRTPNYNRRVGGARNSRHVQADAADIVAKGYSAEQVHARILDLYRAGKLPRLGGLGLYPGFVHVDVRPRGVGGRIARWNGGRANAENVA